MRYLHPVQGHEKFVASGIYKFYKNADELPKTEEWTIHAHANGEQIIRLDADSRFDDGKSIMLETLQAQDGSIVRFDVNYQNPKFENGVKSLRATFTIEENILQIGYSMNGAEREYREIDLPSNTVMDIPFSIFRGQSTVQLAEAGNQEIPVFVPMLDYPQLFPGVVQMTKSQVEFVREEEIGIGKQGYETRRYRYPDKALSYWIDQYNIVLKRVNAHNQHEFVTIISNYAHQ